MDKEIINSVIKYLKQALEQEGVSVESIALFGSTLNNNADSDSDIDLIIISPDFENLDIFERANLTMNPEIKTQKEFMVPMDILSLTPEEYKNSILGLFYRSEIIV